MDLQLTEKRAFISGSTSGIGEATARLLAAEGAAVIVHGRREAEAVRIAEEISQTGGTATVVIDDLSDAHIAKMVSQKALASFSGVDILVNNVGLYPHKPWFDTPDTEWLGLYNSNVGSAIRLIHDLAPQMKEQHWGRVITIANGVATTPIPFVASYAASKAALLNMAINLSKELSGLGVTSNAISPGPIRTPGTETMFRELAVRQGIPDDWAQIEAFIVEHVAPTPVGRLGQAQDIACMVAFLASPCADFISGTNMRVDGGAVGIV
ncbi:MAG: hypothetical protein GFH27_549283n203 [Chloroflexi bacterium AL-W]|nr:hypothetical protein [Chloroflexi bacterium AL-N1]NOK64676.1 hypothetical protein [Chloroflexi bacterium AL-N10]NOK75917.1 hypothetical protein [Chloroflexi bacterium AL-N5]NOK80324.1 hypothetical protein [Chloroflexi bacterium AL-W]NOK86837.1 hypothetical protein [Chloroflexi bacterium AL-N15]